MVEGDVRDVVVEGDVLGRCEGARMTGQGVKQGEEVTDECVIEDWDDCGRRRYHESRSLDMWCVLIGLEVNGVIGDTGDTGDEDGEVAISFQSSRLVTNNSEVNTK